MISNNYSKRLFGRTRGRSKKKIDLKKYHQTVNKYKFQNCDKKINYILDIGTGYGETSIFLAKQFLDKQIKVDNDVLKYAIPRMERSFLFAKKLVEELDLESLKTNKPIKKIMVNKIIEKLNSKT